MREAGLARGERWQARHQDRIRVIRNLRRAGYVQRHRWSRRFRGVRRYGPHEVDSFVYLEGPAQGLEAVDCWKVARKVAACCERWFDDLRAHLPESGLQGVQVVARPRRCGLVHHCPVCAHEQSKKIAEALRVVIGWAWEKRPALLVALVTWTHRDEPGESLGDALGRWRSAWSKMTTGRPGRRWAALVDGAYYGLEVTRRWPGKDDGRKRPRRGAWWHVHGHGLVIIDPDRSTGWEDYQPVPWGRDHDAAWQAVRDEDRARGWGDEEQAAAARRRLVLLGVRAAVGKAWRACSERAACDVGLRGHGWDPVAGGCRVNDRREVTTWAGGWWRDLPAGDLSAVYQAAKYPTPLVVLDPVDLAEWVAAAHGRHWHDGKGSLQSVMKLAKELQTEEPERADDQDQEGEEAAPAVRVQLGEAVGRTGYGEAPDVDEDDGQHGAEWALRWERAEDVPPWMVWAIEDAGGIVYQGTRWVPAPLHPEEEKPDKWIRVPVPCARALLPVGARVALRQRTEEDCAAAMEQARQREGREARPVPIRWGVARPGDGA